MNKKYILKGENEVLISKAESVINKSTFIAYVYNVEKIEQINKILNNIRATNKDAKHIIYAYTLENTGRFTDDKEPSGTAGKPIYAMLEKENLVNTLIVVVRYFGGILLGTGPLTRAYLSVATSAVQKCQKEEYIKYEKQEIEIDYAEEKNFIRDIEKKQGKILNINYGEKIKIIYEAPKN